MPERPGLPSLDVVLSAVGREREKQMGHFEALDSKAGVTLGFSGAIVALATDVESGVAKVGVGLAVLAGVLAMVSFLPRRQPVFDLRHVRDSYLRAEANFTKLHLLDTEIRMVSEASRVITGKAWLLTASLAVLAAAIALLATGTLLS